MSARTDAWRDAGSFEEIGGHRLFVHTTEGEGTPLLLLHGFPSSSFDWRGMLDSLPGRPTLAFDFLGFGFSDKPRDHLYSLSWQADAAEELVKRHLGGGPVFVAAHDMGTSVTTELLARDLRGELGFELAGVVLFNGNVLLHLGSLTPGQKLLRSPLAPLASRLTSRRGFALQFGRLFSDEHPLSKEEAEDQWELLACNGGHRLMHKTIHYLNEREELTERWHGAVRDWPGDVTFMWGLEDPVATTRVYEGLQELRPQAPAIDLPGLGHYPQVERPDLVAEKVSSAARTAG